MDELSRELEERITRIYEAGLVIGNIERRPKLEDVNRLEDLRAELVECQRLVDWYPTRSKTAPVI
jgi:hypothetical protein